MTGNVSPALYAMRPNPYLLPAGTEWWRVHNRARSAAQFNPVSVDAHFGGNRFDGTSYDPYPYLYLASDPATALAETLLRSLDFDTDSGMRLIPYAAVANKALSVLRTRFDRKLISLISEEDLAAVCQDSWLLETEGDGYAKTRRWASEMRAQEPDAAGLVWQSRRHRPRLASVLFQDRCGKEPLTVTTVAEFQDLGSPAGVAAVNRILAPLRAAVVDPWR
ncbi:RES family NAD+ phosphorylase [Streptomyces hesseae]|uniref:RES family NAD+ phosphorylase n=1 Tax=Streptomyces hesseae TaxID=3075519 RepID=A0ABU2SFZ2_9ACTN|nr:RES family NAD+ phosphorylase [Streptomyces sp. DSM 40473]MDT0447896.1 RES family NAD+ phosphorylase [Streptomyces sp. DSM 40473]